MGEIIYHNFGGGTENSEISIARKLEIEDMASKIKRMETFFDEVTIDDVVYGAIAKAYPVYQGHMETDLLKSTEADWVGRLEYFRRIFDVFSLENFQEMQYFLKFKEGLSESA